jgi:hypothetical protein
MAGQEHEDLEFLWSQAQFPTVQGHGSLVEIDLKSPTSILSVREAFRSAVSRWSTLPQDLVIKCRKLQLLVI